MRKKNKMRMSFKKVEEKSKPIEFKKVVKPEPEPVKPVVVETKTEEMKIEEPVVFEIKEEVPAPVIETPEPVKEPEVVVETKEEKKKPEQKKTTVPKKSVVKEETKKRGRPKKK
jgi:hypothetical protein